METGKITPLLDSNSTKGIIIQILSQTSPLSTKELYSETQKHKQLSYQALHKAIGEMVTEEILTKAPDKKYEINKEWIEKMSLFTTNLKSKKENPIMIETNKSETYTFDNFVEFARFTIRFFLDAPNPENKEGVCILNHSWPLFGMSNTDYELLKRLFSETPFYEIVKHNTPLDLAFSKTVEQIGKKVKSPEKYDSNCDIVVKGNKVFQAFYTDDFAKKFDNLYKKHKNMNDSVMNELIVEIMAPKTKITVIIFQDKEIAEKIRKNVLARYKD